MDEADLARVGAVAEQCMCHGLHLFLTAVLTALETLLLGTCIWSLIKRDPNPWPR